MDESKEKVDQNRLSKVSGGDAGDWGQDIYCMICGSENIEFLIVNSDYVLCKCNACGAEFEHHFTPFASES